MPNHLELVEPNNTNVSAWINCTPLNAKSFWLSAIRSGKRVPVSEADFNERWSILLFYPKCFSETHWRELVALSDYYELFQKHQIDIYPVVKEYWQLFRYQSLFCDAKYQAEISFSIVCSDGGDALQECFGIEPSYGAGNDRFLSILGPQGDVKINEILASDELFLPAFLFQKVNKLLNHQDSCEEYLCH